MTYSSTLDGAITADSTDVFVDDAPTAPYPPFIQIGSELMAVVSVQPMAQYPVLPGSRVHIAVQRGALGTARATHGDAAAIYAVSPVVQTSAPAAPPASEVGGEQSVLTRTVTLTDAQVKAIRATPCEIVPPTEVLEYNGIPTSLPIVLSCVVVANLASGYNNYPVPSVLRVVYGSDFSVGAGRLTDDGVLTEAQQMFAAGVHIARMGTFDDDPVGNAAGNYQDNGLYLTYSNGEADTDTAGALTGGDSANTWTVTIAYIVLEISA